MEQITLPRTPLPKQQVNLVGISYGTRVALEYLRRHPGRTRSVVLDGVVPPELALGAEHARNLDAAIDSQFALCEKDTACRRQYGSPRASLDRLLADLESQPSKVRYRDPLTDETREDLLTRVAVTGVVRMYTYVPLLASIATFVIDQRGKVIAWNHAIETLTGVPAQEMLGKGEYAYSIPFYGRPQPILIDLVLRPREEIPFHPSFWLMGILHTDPPGLSGHHDQFLRRTLP